MPRKNAVPDGLSPMKAFNLIAPGLIINTFQIDSIEAERVEGEDTVYVFRTAGGHTHRVHIDHVMGEAWDLYRMERL